MSRDSENQTVLLCLDKKWQNFCSQKRHLASHSNLGRKRCSTITVKIISSVTSFLEEFLYYLQAITFLCTHHPYPEHCTLIIVNNIYCVISAITRNSYSLNGQKEVYKKCIATLEIRSKHMHYFVNMYFTYEHNNVSNKLNLYLDLYNFASNLSTLFNVVNVRLHFFCVKIIIFDNRVHICASPTIVYIKIIFNYCIKFEKKKEYPIFKIICYILYRISYYLLSSIMNSLIYLSMNTSILNNSLIQHNKIHRLKTFLHTYSHHAPFVNEHTLLLVALNLFLGRAQYYFRNTLTSTYCFKHNDDGKFIALLVNIVIVSVHNIYIFFIFLLHILIPAIKKSQSLVTIGLVFINKYTQIYSRKITYYCNNMYKYIFLSIKKLYNIQYLVKYTIIYCYIYTCSRKLKFACMCMYLYGCL